MSMISFQSLPSCIEPARRLASRLGVSFDEIALHRFPDGELRATVGPAATTTILYASLDQPNEKLIALLFAAEALRRGGAKRLVLLAPYMCYMRQDTAFHEGEAISQHVVGRLLAATVDRIITVDAHLHRTPDIAAVFPGIEAENLSAMTAIANELARSPIDPATIVIGPDAESRPWVGDLAGRLGLEHAVAEKKRSGDRSVEIELATPVSGRPVLLVDDIVASGGTLITVAKTLKAAGAIRIDVVVTHALFPPEMTSAFTEAGIGTIRSTHSVPHPPNSISLDELFAAALRPELTEERFAEKTK